MAVQTAADKRTRERLFTLNFQYQPGIEQRTSSKGKPGLYRGSGVGSAHGDEVSGFVDWDLYEDQSVDRCDASFAGVIMTFDGAEIEFETRGCLYVPDKAQPNIWVTNSEVEFSTDDARYAWLDGRVGSWEGQFDMDAFHHHYHVYLHPDDCLASQL